MTLKKDTLICIFITNLYLCQRSLCYTYVLHYLEKTIHNICGEHNKNIETRKKMLTYIIHLIHLILLKEYILRRKYTPEFNVNTLFSFVVMCVLCINSKYFNSFFFFLALLVIYFYSSIIDIL